MYKSMILNNSNAVVSSKSSSDLNKIDVFLENEKQTNSNETWSKLDKTAKTKKLIVFANAYKIKNNLTDEEYDKLIFFFKECLDKKRLSRVKDVNYDNETGEIKDINGLLFNKTNNNFTLKNNDKRTSTLKGLAPKKKQGTVKNKPTIIDSDGEDEDENKEDISKPTFS